MMKRENDYILLCFSLFSLIYTHGHVLAMYIIVKSENALLRKKKKRRKNRLFVYELHPSMATRLYWFSWVPGRGSPGGGRG